MAPLRSATGRRTTPSAPESSSRKKRRDESSLQAENLEKAAQLMIKRMDKLGIKHALAVIVSSEGSERHEHDSTMKLAKAHPDRIKVMAGGALLKEYLENTASDAVTPSKRIEFRKVAEEILKEGAVGFGEMISYHLSMASHHPFHLVPADHPFFLELADIAATHDVPIDIHMEAIEKPRPTPANLLKASPRNPKTLEPTVPALERLLSHNRKARIVWQHIGWDNTGEMTPALVSRLLDKHPNLFIALRVENRLEQVGGGGEMPNRLVDGEGLITASWRTVIERFYDRVVIGSDEFFFPVETSDPRPNQSFDPTWAILRQLPPETADRIGGLNAMKIYGLN